jgi:hypothetical protein
LHHFLWIVHCPWPSSQFNKWHAHNLWLSSSLLGSSGVFHQYI